MNILILGESTGVGGLEVHMSSLASSLVRMGHNVQVVLFTPRRFDNHDRQILLSLFRAKQVRVVCKDKCDIFSAAVQLDLMFDLQNFDIWHSHTAFTSEVCDMIGARYNRPYVQTIHGKSGFESSMALRRAGQVIFVSQELADWFASTREETVSNTVIPNGVELQSIQPSAIASQGFKVVYASRVDSDHMTSIERFLSGMVAASRESRQVKGEIFGTGSCVESLVHSIDVVNRTVGKDLLVYRGFSQDLAVELHRYNVVVGVGRVVLEALAAGRPAIVLGRWGYGGLVKEENFEVLEKANFSGRNVETPFEPSCFAQEIRRLAEDKRLYAELCELGRSIARERYSQQSVATRTMEIYKKCLCGMHGLSVQAPPSIDEDHEIYLREQVFFLAPDFLDSDRPWRTALQMLSTSFTSYDPVTLVVFLYPDCGLQYDEAIEALRCTLSDNDEVDVLVLTNIVDYQSIARLLARVIVYVDLGSPFDKRYLETAFMSGCTIVRFDELAGFLSDYCKSVE